MKDAYSFDRDEAGLDASFRSARRRYHRIFERCGLEVLGGAGGVGDDGRQASRSTSSPRRARARTCSSRARTATTRPTSRSRAASRARPSSRRALDAPEEVETPGVTTIEALAELLAIDAGGDVEGDARR